ncbi:hypothetical protein BDF22DRAFT_662018 [Syncephalis plumigaleata]|nr:hypothetical protein BDF22DRAFT_662018 [Syncephalis plumigaleata]
MSNATTLREKAARMVEDKDWRVLAGAAAIAALTGLGVWWLISGDKSSGGAKGGKRRIKKKKKTKKAGVSASRDLDASKSDATVADEDDIINYTDEQIGELSEKERRAHAQTMKTKGNTDYAAKKYESAIVGYTQAIKFYSEDPVFYANRAACYLSVGRYHDCIRDCDEALKRDSMYIKALNRRAAARENLMEYEEAVNDYTACCIIDEFKNQNFAVAMERALKALTEEKTKEVLKERESKDLGFPSGYVIASYLEGFRCCIKAGVEEALSSIPEDSSQAGDDAYRSALTALLEEKYADAEKLIIQAVEAGCTRQHHAFALYAMFFGLRGNMLAAMRNFSHALELKPNDVETLVLRGATLLQLGDVAAGMEQFTQALAIDDANADVYYNRGQGYFIQGDLANAAADYKKAIELDDSRSVAFIQLGMTQYRLGEKRAAEATFRRAARAFPDSAHVRIFHSELLIDQQRFDDAEKLLEEATKLDPTNALAWVNRALLYMQQKGDPTGAEELLKKAIEVDNECEAAMISLAQIYLQQSKMADALALFERGVELARTEQEISTMVGYCEATRTQIMFTKQHPALASRLTALHGGF